MTDETNQNTIRVESSTCVFHRTPGPPRVNQESLVKFRYSYI
jgi:hypothetical protein